MSELKGIENEKKWTETHTKIYELKKDGKTQNEIGEVLGIPQSKVSTIINSPLYKKVMDANFSVEDTMTEVVSDKLRDNKDLMGVFAKLAKNTAFAIEEITRIARNGETERIRFEACKELLDRAGYKAPQVNINRNIDYSPADILSASTVIEEYFANEKLIKTGKNPFLIENKEKVIDVQPGPASEDRPTDVSEEPVLPL